MVVSNPASPSRPSSSSNAVRVAASVWPIEANVTGHSLSGLGEGSSVLAKMNNLKTKIRRKSSKYSFASRRDAGSERVDWEFVGFPSSNNAGSSAVPSFTLEGGVGGHQQPVVVNRGLNFQRDQLQRRSMHDAPISFNLDEPVNNNAIPVNNNLNPSRRPGEQEPPPVPPRQPPIAPRNYIHQRSSQENLTTRPTSLYSKLDVPLAASNKNELSRKRPRSNVPSPLSEEAGTPPSIPPHQHNFKKVQEMPRSPPPIPPHLHGSGVPHPLPLSPPAPPPPPHASPVPPSMHHQIPTRGESPTYFEPVSQSGSPPYDRPLSLILRPPKPIPKVEVENKPTSPLYRKPISLRNNKAKARQAQAEARAKAAAEAASRRKSFQAFEGGNGGIINEGSLPTRGRQRRMSWAPNQEMVIEERNAYDTVPEPKRLGGKTNPQLKKHREQVPRQSADPARQMNSRSIDISSQESLVDQEKAGAKPKRSKPKHKKSSKSSKSSKKEIPAGEVQHPQTRGALHPLPLSSSQVQSPGDNPDHSMPTSSSAINLNSTPDASGPSPSVPVGSNEKLHLSPARGHLKDAAAASSSPKAGNRVDRSQSLRDQEAVSRGQKRGTPGRERRKNSDPNLPRGGTRQSDVEVEIPPHQQTTSSGSSTSSLSASRSSVDSPAGSQEMVTAASASAVPSSSTPISSHSQAFRSPGPQSLEHHYHTIDGDDFEAPDSDYEPSTEDWRKALAKEDLDRLGKKESQRQDVLNELFNTERSHVRNLKVLDRLFYRPLVAESAHSLGQHKEFVESLFPNLPDVLAWHTKCNQKMKDKVKRLGYPVGNIGDILSEMFFGDNGDKLIEIGSTFTKNQKFTIEELKDRRKRDQRFDKFLTETENKPECRRLQLQALLPMEHQRLVKYPLLLNQLWKKGSEICDKTEQDIVHSCQERTCVILENIDRRVAEAQNMHMMAEIQKNLDTSGLDKLPDSPLYKEFRKVDLTQHTLLYDGVLTMKLGQKPKTKTVDLHVLLLEDCVMLLQKQDDKYLLKYHMTNSLAMTAANQSNMGKTCFAPIIKVSNLLIRPNATDKRSFYLLNNSPNGPQFYELATQSSTDRAQWFKHITEATNAFNSRDESQRASDRSGSDLSSQNGPLDGSSQAGAANDLVGGPGYEGGKASGRSESFKSAKHESDRDSNEDSVSKKTGDGNVNQSNDPANSSSSGQRKRLQRVEILKIAEPCPLIDPSQVVVTQGEIFMAEPILTPIEKLRRKDLEVARALEEKKQLLAEILNVPTEHFDDIADIASSQPSHDKDAREVLLAALAQAKSLCDLVNQILNMNDEDRMVLGSEVSLNSSYTRNTSSSSSSTREQQRPLSPTSGISGDVSTAGSGPSSLMSSKLSSSNSTTRQLHPLTGRSAGKLVSISVNLNSQLTTLLGKIQELDEERERMKRELQRSQEQVHAYLSQSTSVRTSSMSAVSPGSRPASFISVEESSGAGDLSEKGTQESGGEDDALPTNMYENISSSDQDLPEPVTPTNAKPLEEPPASSSDDSPSSPGPYTSLNKEESLENSPSDSDKTVTESTPTYNEEAPPSNETAPGPDETEDLDLAGANATASPVQETEE
ncbi:uncharacterized protein LOC131884098 isoform X14 [Tigriopus californicus]|uniref:uncharacterized protein LOC131884098 isoform X14 n=1 Tax=Tigriopus californicus TaxID=6832 RepID=UPI0027DA4CD2|nr:uncharacterized protein LOC131884098 isoform X14 [Tigriopus californicus]